MTKKTNVVVLVVIHHNGKYLLTRRASIDSEDSPDFMGKWEVPGGGLEFGEHPEATAHREIIEEIGCTIEIQQQLPTIYSEIRENWHGVFITYIAKLTDQSQQVVLSDEADAWGWYTVDEMLKLAYLPLLDKIIVGAEEILIKK